MIFHPKFFSLNKIPIRTLLLSFALLTTWVSSAWAVPKTPPGMVYVPEGYFQMGQSTSASEDQKPMHFVYTSASFIDKYEVSNAEYKKFMDATGHGKPKYWDDERFTPKRPVRRGSMRQRYGDNIYHRDSDGSWVQADSRHSHNDGSPNVGHITKDTSADAVLLSRDYVYFGRSAPEIPERLRSWPGPAWNGSRFDSGRERTYDLCMTYSGFRRHLPEDMKDAAVGWLRDLIDEDDHPYRGDPADW